MMGLQVAKVRKSLPKAKQGRIVAVFGIPFSGKTTLVNAIQGASKKIVAVISTGDIARSLITEEDKAAMAKGGLFPREEEMRDEILKKIDQFRQKSAEVIFIDGCPRFDDQVLWLWEQKLVGRHHGKIVKVEASNPAIIRRSGVRKRIDDDVASFRDRILHQKSKFPEIDRMIQKLGLMRDYYTIQNEDNDTIIKRGVIAACNLIKIAQLEEGYSRGKI
jgi:adenylate kinase family enzyme